MGTFLKIYILIFVSSVQIQIFFLFAHLCEKVNLHNWFTAFMSKQDGCLNKT